MIILFEGIPLFEIGIEYLSIFFNIDIIRDFMLEIIYLYLIKIYNIIII